MSGYEETAGGSVLLDRLLYDAPAPDPLWLREDPLATVPVVTVLFGAGGRMGGRLSGKV